VSVPHAHGFQTIPHKNSCRAVCAEMFQNLKLWSSGNILVTINLFSNKDRWILPPIDPKMEHSIAKMPKGSKPEFRTFANGRRAETSSSETWIVFVRIAMNQEIYGRIQTNKEQQSNMIAIWYTQIWNSWFPCCFKVLKVLVKLSIIICMKWHKSTSVYSSTRDEQVKNPSELL